MSTIDLALLLLRLGAGLTFAAHGAQKLFGWWGGPGLAGWQGAMQKMGYRPARGFAVLSALIEFVGGLALAIGLLTPLLAAVVVAQTVVIIGQVHWRNGFFNSKAGYEFPLMFGVAALAIGLAGAGSVSVDALVGFALDPAAKVVLLALGAVAGLGALAVPHLPVADQAVASR